MIENLLTIPVELVERRYSETPNADGDQEVLETVVATTTCELQAAGSREEQGDAVEITTYRLFLAAGLPLRGWDAVRRIDTGETLELEGDAFEWRSLLTGAASHVEAMVRRTDGGGLEVQPV